MTDIYVFIVRKCGLEVWQVYHGQTYVTEYMSREYALDAARRLKAKLNNAAKAA